MTPRYSEPVTTAPERYTRQRRQTLTPVVRGALIAIATLVVFALFYTVIALASPIPQARARLDAVHTASDQAPANLPWPAARANAVTVVGQHAALAHAGDTKAAPIASLSKMITALVVLEKKPLRSGEQGPDIEFTAADIETAKHMASVDGVTLPVKAGQKLTEHQLLEGALLFSANNFADKLGTWAYGSDEAFASAANTWLHDHGYTDSHLEEPTGLNAGNVSTPENLLGIAETLLKDPILSPIVREKDTDIPGVGHVENRDKLASDAGFRGVKTGHTNEAGYCLVSARDVHVGSQIVTLVSVSLGAANDQQLADQTRPLLDSMTTNLHEVVVAKKGQVVGEVTDATGASIPLRVDRDVTLLEWSNEAATVTISPVSLGNPPRVATLVATSPLGEDGAGGSVRAGIETAKKPAEADFAWRMTHPVR